MKNKNEYKLLNIEFFYHLRAILDWMEQGEKIDLLETAKRDRYDTSFLEGDYWTGQAIKKYHIQILPHPNAIDSIFFHTNVGLFSNSPDASDSISELVETLYPKKKAPLHICSWETQIGFIRLGIETTDLEYKTLFLAPTDEIFTLHQGKQLLDTTFNNIKTNTLEASDRSDSLVTVRNSNGVFSINGNGNDYTKFYRKILYGGKGVCYRNKLCMIKATYTHDQLLYWSHY